MGIDPEQFAFDFYAIMLAFHHAKRLLRDERAEVQVRRAFDRLLSAYESGPNPIKENP